MPHANKEPVHREPNRTNAIEAMVAATCLDATLYKGAISHLVGMVFPWARRQEIFDAVDRMAIAGRLVAVKEERRTIPKFTLAS